MKTVSKVTPDERYRRWDGDGNTRRAFEKPQRGDGTRRMAPPAGASCRLVCTRQYAHALDARRRMRSVVPHSRALQRRTRCVALSDQAFRVEWSSEFPDRVAHSSARAGVS